MAIPVTLHDLKPGIPLGPYIIIKKVADGGMGSVFKAFDPTQERYVAIKVLLPEYANNPIHVRHFHDEARLIASLHHPNIIPVYHFDKINQIAFFSMAFIDGNTLDDWIMEGRRFDLKSVRWFMNQAVSAMDYAAQASLIHLDIKPSNFLVDSEPKILLGDFGLAQNLSHFDPGGHPEVFGTPYYVAPEQIQRHSTDYRTDIYSLGSTLYHLIAGTPPYDSETIEEILTAHLDHPFPISPLLDTGIPVGVAHLIQKMMEKDPSLRFQSYRSLAEAVSRVEEFRYQSPAATTTHAPRPPSSSAIPPLPSNRKDLLYGLIRDSSGSAKSGELPKTTHYTRHQIIGATLNPMQSLSIQNLGTTLQELASPKEGDLDDLIEVYHRSPSFQRLLLRYYRHLNHLSKNDVVEETLLFKGIGLSLSRTLALVDFLVNYEWKPSKNFDWIPLWQHQTACALILDSLYDTLQIKKSGLEFIAGMIHDIGKIILGELYPEAYLDVMNLSLREQIPLPQCELSVFGIEHGELGALWLEHNGIKPEVIAAIRFHSQPQEERESFLLHHALFVANDLTRELVIGYSGNGMLNTASWADLPSTHFLWVCRHRTELSWEQFSAEFATPFRNLPNLFASR